VDLSDDAACQEPVEHPPGGHVPGPDGLRQEYALLFGEGADVLRLFRVQGEGLLADYVFAVTDRQHHVLIVAGVGRGHIDQLHLRVPQERLIAAVGLPEAVFFGEGLCPLQGPGSHRPALNLADGGQSRCRQVSDASNADHAQFHSQPPHFHGFSLF